MERWQFSLRQFLAVMTVLAIGDAAHASLPAHNRFRNRGIVVGGPVLSAHGTVSMIMAESKGMPSPQADSE